MHAEKGPEADIDERNPQRRQVLRVLQQLSYDTHSRVYLPRRRALPRGRYPYVKVSSRDLRTNTNFDFYVNIEHFKLIFMVYCNAFLRIMHLFFCASTVLYLFFRAYDDDNFYS